MLTTPRAAVLVAAILANAPLGLDAHAQLTRIEVEVVESPAFGGESFGEVGQYERLRGLAYGEIDPGDPRHSEIVNLEHAPLNDALSINSLRRALLRRGVVVWASATLCEPGDLETQAAFTREFKRHTQKARWGVPGGIGPARLGRVHGTCSRRELTVDQRTEGFPWTRKPRRIKRLQVSAWHSWALAEASRKQDARRWSELRLAALRCGPEHACVCRRD